ncbi:unnamed protein product [Linum trigynum]|uniref:Amino acid transporter transmembrane domain-containing protein n=1 Tax=Linum trigynum TaxID=586398 RepID=A0AAV2G4S2_9ROSI
MVWSSDSCNDQSFNQTRDPCVGLSTIQVSASSSQSAVAAAAALVNAVSSCCMNLCLTFLPPYLQPRKGNGYGGMPAGMGAGQEAVIFSYGDDEKRVAFLEKRDQNSSSSYSGGGDGAAAAALVERSGTVWTAVAHIITGVIGSGVLSLQWSVAQLGWAAGPAAMVMFAAVTLVSAFLLCDCYRSPHPLLGPSRNRSYLQAVNLTLGRTKAWACGVLVHTSMYGIGIAYTITAAISMRSIQQSACTTYNNNNNKKEDGACDMSWHMLVFGLAEMFMSQIPNFHDIQWLSNVAALMSLAYSFIGLGLGFARVLENGYVKGSMTGIRGATPVDKMWKVSQALGDIAFAYPYSLILIEIQDTLKSPPSENETMKKASTVAILVTTVFYLCCGGFGYAAFGEDTPGNLLTGFTHPHWLLDFANACIVLHILGGYQVYCQPVFATAEKWLVETFPDSILVRHSSVKLPVPAAGRNVEVKVLRLCFRTLYVASTTAIAMMFPYFNQVIGVLGGFMYWPVSIYFPVEMYVKQREVEAWTVKWVLLHLFSVFCLLLICFALVGSVQGLLTAHLG